MSSPWLWDAALRLWGHERIRQRRRPLHFETGEYAARKGIDQIICIGPLAEHMYQGAKNIASGNTVLYYPDKERFLNDVSSLFQKGDTVLVKASNSMKFSQIVENIKRIRL